MGIETYTLPAYWASYLVNGDASGYTDEEIAEIDTFCKGKGCCVGCSDDSEFSWRNDVNKLGGDVKEFYFPRVEVKK